MARKKWIRIREHPNGTLDLGCVQTNSLVEDWWSERRERKTPYHPLGRHGVQIAAAGAVFAVFVVRMELASNNMAYTRRCFMRL